MLAKYAFTFEFDESAPVTVKGLTEANSLEKMMWRAAKDARKQRPNLR